MKISFAVGVRMEVLCPGDLERDEEKVTRYNNVSGEPYENALYKYFVTLANGLRFEVPEMMYGNDTSSIQKYFKKLGFDCLGRNFFYGVVGIKLTENKSKCDDTMSCDAFQSEGLDVSINAVRGMLLNAGFSKDVVDTVKLQVIADA